MEARGRTDPGHQEGEDGVEAQTGDKNPGIEEGTDEESGGVMEI